jgi:hypothetical protein
MRALLPMVLLMLAGCAGAGQEPSSEAGEDEAGDASRAKSEEPNELSRSLIHLQAPDIGEQERNQALRDFVDLFLRSEVFVPDSGPEAIGDRSGASAFECFTDAASVEVRYPGRGARPMEARDVLAQARDRKYGVVIRHESSKKSVFTGFSPAHAARLLEI